MTGMNFETSSSNNALTIDLTGVCAHVYEVRLGCEPHDYAHTWGYACSKCWDQVFYSDFERLCDKEAA